MRRTTAALVAFYSSKTLLGLPDHLWFTPLYGIVFDALFIQILVEFCFIVFPNNIDELTKPNLMFRLT